MKALNVARIAARIALFLLTMVVIVVGSSYRKETALTYSYTRTPVCEMRKMVAHRNLLRFDDMVMQRPQLLNNEIAAPRMRLERAGTARPQDCVEIFISIRPLCLLTCIRGGGSTLPARWLALICVSGASKRHVSQLSLDDLALL